MGFDPASARYRPTHLPDGVADGGLLQDARLAGDGRHQLVAAGRRGRRHQTSLHAGDGGLERATSSCHKNGRMLTAGWTRTVAHEHPFQLVSPIPSRTFARPINALTGSVILTQHLDHKLKLVACFRELRGVIDRHVKKATKGKTI